MMTHHDEVSARAVAEITRRVAESRRFLAEATPQHDVDLPLPGLARPDTSRFWFACQFNVGKGSRCAQALRRNGVVTFLPTAIRTGFVRGREVVYERALFARYLFLGLDRERRHFHLLRGVDGLESLVRTNGRDASVFDADALGSLWDAWQAGMFDERRTRIAPEFVPGQAVRVVNGPFGDWIGKVARAKPGERVRLMLDVAGKRVRLDVEPKDLERVEG